MNLKRDIGAKVIGFSHLDNILSSLEKEIRTGAPDGGYILDVGCGEMHISSTIAEQLGDEYRVFASDINPNKLRNPTEERYAPRKNHSPVIGDATRLPFKSNKFEVTYSTSFFSHVHSHSSALNEQIRVTKPGGRIVVLDENLLSPYQLYKWLRNAGPEWLFSQSEPKELEVRGFECLGTNENHYSPRYWHQYLSKHDSLTLRKISSPRIEKDKKLQKLLPLPILQIIYTFYETHTVAVTEINK
jgi:ubiquinone/menaquinone biosynthesis C-methylase UbiE